MSFRSVNSSFAGMERKRMSTVLTRPTSGDSRSGGVGSPERLGRARQGSASGTTSQRQSLSYSNMGDPPAVESIMSAPARRVSTASSDGGNSSLAVTLNMPGRFNLPSTSSVASRSLPRVTASSLHDPGKKENSSKSFIQRAKENAPPRKQARRRKVLWGAVSRVMADDPIYDKQEVDDDAWSDDEGAAGPGFLLPNIISANEKALPVLRAYEEEEAFEDVVGVLHQITLRRSQIGYVVFTRVLDFVRDTCPINFYTRAELRALQKHQLVNGYRKEAAAAAERDAHGRQPQGPPGQDEMSAASLSGTLKTKGPQGPDDGASLRSPAEGSTKSDDSGDFRPFDDSAADGPAAGLGEDVDADDDDDDDQEVFYFPIQNGRPLKPSSSHSRPSAHGRTREPSVASTYNGGRGSTAEPSTAGSAPTTQPLDGRADSCDEWRQHPGKDAAEAAARRASEAAAAATIPTAAADGAGGEAEQEEEQTFMTLTFSRGKGVLDVTRITLRADAIPAARRADLTPRLKGEAVAAAVASATMASHGTGEADHHLNPVAAGAKMSSLRARTEEEQRMRSVLPRLGAAQIMSGADGEDGAARGGGQATQTVFVPLTTGVQRARGGGGGIAAACAASTGGRGNREEADGLSAKERERLRRIRDLKARKRHEERVAPPTAAFDPGNPTKTTPFSDTNRPLTYSLAGSRRY